MAEYEHTQTVQASPDVVYRFVSEVGNLPKYLPTTKSAQMQGADRVQVQGEANGHTYDDDGFFRRDEANRRLEWGSDDDHYKGWLRIDGDGNRSNVTVHLTFQKQEIPDQDERVRRGLRAALESIQNQVEGDGGKVEVREATG
jgi:uncharacterized membrane protein